MARRYCYRLVILPFWTLIIFIARFYAWMWIVEKEWFLVNDTLMSFRT